jgi:2-polyprenyl-3-methyl-5-hydroxy-6-metoxy-1,4-benzoquinol methylase
MQQQTWHPGDLESIPCDLCKRFETRDLFRRPDGMQVVQCVNCGLAYLNPRSRPEMVARLYDQEYYNNSNCCRGVGYSADYLGASNREAMISNAESKLCLIHQLWEPLGKKSLEVGCATGEFSYVLKQCGADPVAIDLSDFVIAEARKRQAGIDFRVGGIEVFHEAAMFDAVFAFEVIEHVLSPCAFLGMARQLLKPGGLLVLSTPNLGCAEAIGYEKWLGFQISFEHLYFLAPEPLKKMAQQQGLSLAAWFTGGGSGAFSIPQESRFKSATRKMLEVVKLLDFIRTIRGRPPHQASAYTAGGHQHNLLAILAKAS